MPSSSLPLPFFSRRLFNLQKFLRRAARRDPSKKKGARKKEKGRDETTRLREWERTKRPQYERTFRFYLLIDHRIVLFFRPLLPLVLLYLLLLLLLLLLLCQEGRTYASHSGFLPDHERDLSRIFFPRRKKVPSSPSSSSFSSFSSFSAAPSSSPPAGVCLLPPTEVSSGRT